MAMAPAAVACGTANATQGTEGLHGPPTPTVDSGTTPVTTGTATASATPAPLAPVLLTDPNQLAQLVQQSLAALSPSMQGVGAIPGDPMELGLRALGARLAPGMQPDGPMAKGTLREGDHLAFMTTLEPGRCYTIVGFSPPTQVANLDLNLFAPPLYLALAGQDTTDDAAPSLGKENAPMCPIVPIALQYKVDVVARKGAGMVGVQVFSKPK
jgi:hypothetical protein